MHTVSIRKVKPCKRKKLKALAASAAIDELPWSGNPALKVPILITEDNTLAYPENDNLPLSFAMSEYPLFTDFDIPNPRPTTRHHYTTISTSFI